MGTTDKDHTGGSGAKTVVLALIAIVVIGLLVWVARRGGETPPPTVPDTPVVVDDTSPVEPVAAVAPAGEPTPFLELIYEQQFVPFGEQSWPAPARLPYLQGYVHDRDQNVLYPVMPTATTMPADGYLLGLRLHFPHNHPRLEDFQTLAMPAGESPRWELGAVPTIRQLERAGTLAWWRFPLTLQAMPAADGALTVRLSSPAGEQSETLQPGSQATLWTAERELTLAQLVAEINTRTETDFGVNPELDAAALARQMRLEPDQPMTVHARLLARHHGEVLLSPTDLGVVFEQGSAALRSGDLAAAESAFATVHDVLPELTLAADLLAETRRRQAAGETISLLRGTVALPEAVEMPARSWVGIREPSSPEDEALAATYLEKNAFSLNIPNGPYVVTLYMPGFKPVSRTIDVLGETTVELSVAETDKLPPRP